MILLLTQAAKSPEFECMSVHLVASIRDVFLLFMFVF